MTTTDNTRLVVELYTRAFNDGEPEAAAAAALGETHTQHNPGAPDGVAGFVGFVQAMRGRFPQLRLDIRRTVAEGDLVVTHSEFHLEPGDRGMAVADIWRIADGRVVEHWDVIQQVPEQSANGHPMV